MHIPWVQTQDLSFHWGIKQRIWVDGIQIVVEVLHIQVERHTTNLLWLVNSNIQVLYRIYMHFINIWITIYSRYIMYHGHVGVKNGGNMWPLAWGPREKETRAQQRWETQCNLIINSRIDLNQDKSLIHFCNILILSYTYDVLSKWYRHVRSISNGGKNTSVHNRQLTVKSPGSVRLVWKRVLLPCFNRD